LIEQSLPLPGWKFEGRVPEEKKYVVLAVPHTSNWDGLVLMAVTQGIGLKLAWMIKDSWLKGPMGPILRRLGAVGIDRSQRGNVVAQMVARFNAESSLVLAIPPEGTRSRVEYWKSGFYHIAREANVPVVPGYLDYARKRAGLGPALWMTGDVKSDMDRIRGFYTQMAPRAHDPSKVGPMRLREEDASSTVPNA